MARADYLVIERPPFNVDRITKILRKADLICAPGGLVGEFDPYHLPDYRVQAQVHGCKAVFLFDLNVLRRISSLHPAAGGAPAGQQERVAAALMAFGVYADVLMEPGLALMEWFSPDEHLKVAEQIRRFRELDNTDPDAFAGLALGSSDRLPSHRVPALPPVALPQMPERPTGWQFDYTALLKVAALTLRAEQTNEPRARVMEEYLEWCWRDFLFSSPAIQFGGLYLSPERKKRMFKDLRSGDPQKALAGIENATWDLAYLREWGKRTLEQRGTTRFHLFCSLDRALRESAREFLFLGDEVPLDAHERLWGRLWGDREGHRLMGVYRALAERQDDPSRAWHSMPKLEHAEQFKQKLEEELTALVHGRRVGS